MIQDPAILQEAAAQLREVLEKHGFLIDEDPIFDGRVHRVRTHEDGSEERSGAYLAYPDGHPAGWYQDHRHDDRQNNWKMVKERKRRVRGKRKTAQEKKAQREQREQWRREAEEKQQEREVETRRKYAHVAKWATKFIQLLPDANHSVVYLGTKGIRPLKGMKMDRKGHLVLPLYNEQMEIRSFQRIGVRRFKMLKKGGEKSGNFSLVGGKRLLDGDSIIIAEGVSTAASISMALDRRVVVAIDAGNLPAVALVMRSKYPNSSIIIAGDDDRLNTRKTPDGKTIPDNKGRRKAEEAAALVDGHAIFPVFPKEMEPAKSRTDFNDVHREYGIDEITRQFGRIPRDKSQSFWDDI